MNLSYFILGINVIVFAAMEFTGGSTNTITLLKFGAFYPPFVLEGEFWRSFTSAFIHIGLIHLLVNSFTLVQVGPIIEEYFGKLKFTIFYTLTSLSASTLSILFNYNSISAGASGALFGLVGVILGNLWGKSHSRLPIEQWQIIPFVIFNLVYGFAVPGINNWAHIGGLVGGIVLGFLIGPDGSVNDFGIYKVLTKLLGVVSIIIIVLSTFFWILNFIF